MSSGNQWEDHYTRRARAEKWLARSVYKLEEMDRKYKIIRLGDRLLDLGCYPGSWSQYSLKKVGNEGDVVGMDLKKPERISASNFHFIEADVLALDIHWMMSMISPRDVVISDLAPHTTGITVTDAARSTELARCALDIAAALLRQGGHLLCKVFEGEEIRELREQFRMAFRRLHTLRPDAVRKASKEVYLLGLGFVKGDKKGFFITSQG